MVFVGIQIISLLLENTVIAQFVNHLLASAGRTFDLHSLLTSLPVTTRMTQTGFAVCFAKNRNWAKKRCEKIAGEPETNEIHEELALETGNHSRWASSSAECPLDVENVVVVDRNR